MPKSLAQSSRLDSFLIALSRFSVRHALTVAALGGALALISVWLVVTKLTINTDTEDMISPTLPWRATFIDYRRAFPDYLNNIVVVVDGSTPDLARDGAARLSAALARDTGRFEHVFDPQNDPFFRQAQFLYLGTEELEALAEQLATAQPFIATLASDPTLRGLGALIAAALTPAQADQAIHIAPHLARIAQTIDDFAAGRDSPLSWQQLLTGNDDDSATMRQLFVVKPVLDFSDLLPGASALAAIRTTAKDLGLTPSNGLVVRLTGSAALSVEELESVMRGVQQASLIALALVVALLTIGLRSLSLVVSTLIILIIGLLTTAAFASVVIGTLNMISIAFAILYVGLGVDFAIHYCLRYREFAPKQSRMSALGHTSIDVGRALLLCTVTTAIGFLAFVPTAYRGVAELGLISGAGICIALALTLCLLPALLSLLPAPQAAAAVTKFPYADAPIRHARSIRIATALLTLIALACLPAVTFDHNPLHLTDPNTESAQTFRELLDDADRSPYAISIIAPSADARDDWSQALAALPSVASVVSLADLIPADQETKMAVIDDLNFTLGTDIEFSAPHNIDAETRLRALSDLQSHLRTFQSTTPVGAAHGAAAALAEALERLMVQIPVEPAPRETLLRDLETRLFQSLPSNLQRLNDALSAEIVTLDKLPASLLRRWRDDNERYRLQVNPAQDLDDNANLETFVAQVRGIVGDHATDIPVINLEASRAVRHAFAQAFATAFIVIAIILWFALRQVRLVLIALAPLLLASAVTAMITVLVRMPFNFANIIALPLLLGIGVDGSLHMLHRARALNGATHTLLNTSTARAILFSTLTTAASFGNLALSPHTGTASMGVLLTIGIVTTLACTLIVLPAIISASSLTTRGT